MSTTTQAKPTSAAKGTYIPSGPNDLRGPCPVINSLANHGYLPRDGRDCRVGDFTAAMHALGISPVLGATLSNPIFLERVVPGLKGDDVVQPSRSLLGKIWYIVRNPWAIAFTGFGMRRPGQVDSMGNKCLGLDQFALHGAVEHDISLSRWDIAQGDNHTRQPELVKRLLESSSDGGKTLTLEDLANFRRRRIEEQKESNPEVTYEKKQHQTACGEIALILSVFGDRKSIPCEYVRALFLEERLPVQEGWKKRQWWTVGLVELERVVSKVKKFIGLQI
ncbi:hypothetical protein JX265_005654 [Neoarthrinium moseri]|uniref:Heme haloperoxidase family profile domain-containing protein n=1 Tax=Neoarthrinium moseri TaxID=1658444 RepID=A0A9P9WN78_9PEZI|nr:hypothetical protein JX266_005579 [Neoarthrinium moseri]KAI1871668.1 hypothetical protein JX265_005654 [Neoarthrinium moseri]